jgi:methylated-DNA-[protein]-cysteine S-methyltransferase
VTLLVTSISTPIGNLNLIADEHILLGANLSTLKALKESLSAEDSEREIKSVPKIPVITDLIIDYFDGDISAINAIQVRQPGAHFSQAAWRAMKKIRPGSVISGSCSCCGKCVREECDSSCSAMPSHRKNWWCARKLCLRFK